MNGAGGEPLPWWQHRATIAALLLVAVAPLLLTPGLPALTDLPGHVARWHIAIAAPGSPLNAYYRIDWAWVGNLGTDLPGVPLSRLVGALWAGKLIVLAIALATPAAMLWLSREAHGRIAPAALFALPFAFAWPFQLGFLNFALAQALAFAALALSIRLGRQGRTGLRAALHAPIGLILWTAHSAGWGMFGLMAFGAELARLRGDGSNRGRSWARAIGGAVLACLPLALPVLVMLAQRGGGQGAGAGDWFDPAVKLVWLLSSLRDRWQWFDLVSLGLAIVLLYTGLRDRRLGLVPLLGWPALLCLAAFLLLPRLLMGGAYVDMRMLPAAWALALLAIRPPADPKLAGRLALAGLAFFAVRSAAMTASLLLRGAEQRAELAALDHVPQGSAVLSLVARPCLTPWSDMRPEHLPAYAILQRDAFTNEQWAIAGQQYLHVRYKAAGAFRSDPSQLAYPAGCEVGGGKLPDVLAHFPRTAFRHLWLIGARLPAPERYGLRPIWSSESSALYEVIGTVPPRRVERRP